VEGAGPKYRKDQIVTWPHYEKSPGSPAWGDATKEMQANAIDALIDASKKHGLDTSDTAHVLAIARHESGFNPYAAAGTTSATGLGQFLDKTGNEYMLGGMNRWNINMQSDALVSLFLKNKDKAVKLHLPEPYIYKYHHDGINSKQNEGKGLSISYEKVMPQLGNIYNVIQKKIH